MSPFLIVTLLVALVVLFLVVRVVVRRRRIRASRKRARGPLPAAAQRAQERARELLGRNDVLIAATKTTSFQPSAEVIELSLIDTTGAVRLGRVMLPTGTITREAIAAHGLDRDELQRLRAPHYLDVHEEIEAALAAAAVVLAYDAPLEHRRLYRTAAGHERELAGSSLGVRAGALRRVRRQALRHRYGLAPLDPEPGATARGSRRRQAAPACPRRLSHGARAAAGDHRQRRPLRPLIRASARAFRASWPT